MPTGIYIRTPEMKTGKHMKGRKLSQSFINSKGYFVKGRKNGPMSEEHKNKIRLARLGKPHPCKGHKEKKFSPWTKKEYDAYYLRHPDKLKIYKRQEIYSFRYKSHNKEYPLGWIEIRKKIYKRDNWLCQECGIHCSKNGGKSKIQCHHVDYNINNNSFSNLITLCASCHSKTNFKRQDWKNYFKDKFLLTFPSQEEETSKEVI